MIDPQAEVFARLTGDATLTALLLDYNSAPAVFEDGKVPPELEHGVLPIVVVTPATNNANPDTLSASMRQEIISVRLYHKPDGSSLPLQQAAERVRALFKNWGGVAIDGGDLIHSEVAGPMPAPVDDPSIDGRIVQTSLLIKEN